MSRTDRWPRRVSCPAHALPMLRSRHRAPRSVSRVRPSGHLLPLLRSSRHSVKAGSKGSDRARRQSGDASAARRRPAHQRSARRKRTLQHRRSANHTRPCLVRLLHGRRHRRLNGAHRLPGLSTRPGTCRASRRTACTAPHPKRGLRARAHRSREHTMPGPHANPRRRVGARAELSERQGPLSKEGTAGSLASSFRGATEQGVDPRERDCAASDHGTGRHRAPQDVRPSESPDRKETGNDGHQNARARRPEGKTSDHPWVQEALFPLALSGVLRIVHGHLLIPTL